MKKSALQSEYKSLWLDIGNSHPQFYASLLIPELAAALPKRPVVSVFNYCRRAYHPLQKQGKWTEEQDAALRA